MIIAAIKLQILWWYQTAQIYLYKLSISAHIFLMLVVLAIMGIYDYWLFF